MIGGFYWLFLWNFKEIQHQPFSMTQPQIKYLGYGFHQWEIRRKRLYFHYAVEITATYHDRALFFNRNSRQEGFDKRKSLGKERGGV